MKNNFFYAWAILVGTIVGAGIFGIPYALSRAGFFLGILYLCLLGLVVTLIHLCLAEITLRTKGQHRLVGYVRKYLGDKVAALMTFVLIMSLFGALLAYIVLGGQFLANIFGGSNFVWSLAFFVLSGALLFFGLRPIAKTELLMAGFLILIVILILIWSWPQLSLNNLSGLDSKSVFLPYGVIFFALVGNMAVLELKDLLKKELKTKTGGQKMRQVIVTGTLVPALLYMIFALAVVGVTGQATSTEAISGLGSVFGRPIIIIASLFGFLAVFTSFLTLGLGLQKMFHLDYAIPKNWAFILTVFLPLIAYLAGLRNFIVIIGFLGAVLGGLEGVIVMLTYRAARGLKKPEHQPEMSLNLPSFALWILVGLFILGIIYQVYYFVR